MMAGFNVVPLATRPKTSKLIVDSDIDMGVYTLRTAAVNDVAIAHHITVTPSTVELHAYQYNTNVIIPPQKDVLFSGTVAYHANETNPNDVLVAIDAEGNGVELQRGFPTVEETVSFTNIKSLYMVVDTNVGYFKAPIYQS